MRIRHIRLLVVGAFVGCAACTQPQPSRSPAPAPMVVTATAYCIQGTTKSGEPTRPGIIAADPRVIPLGSIVRVEGLPGRYNGTYKVADTGSAVKGRIIDIFMPDCRAARRFGRQQARLSVVESGDALAKRSGQ